MHFITKYLGHRKIMDYILIKYLNVNSFLTQKKITNEGDVLKLLIQK